MSEKTVHGLNTPHGHSTPHKYPSVSETQLDVLNRLSVQLYPTGRAWYRTENGTWEGFHESINKSFVRLINDAKQIINSTYPDNNNFTEEDAKLWEYRLGLSTNESLDLEIRKEALRLKMGHPNNIKARQNPSFIEHQLQLMGFDVYVHENTIPYKTPADVLALAPAATDHGGPTQHEDSTQHGGSSFDIIANSSRPVESFAVGSNLWATFFIGGQTLGDIADVPLQRLKEFKELVLKLKPAHTAAFTFINYI